MVPDPGAKPPPTIIRDRWSNLRASQKYQRASSLILSNDEKHLKNAISQTLAQMINFHDTHQHDQSLSVKAACEQICRLYKSYDKAARADQYFEDIQQAAKTVVKHIALGTREPPSPGNLKFLREWKTIVSEDFKTSKELEFRDNYKAAVVLLSMLMVFTISQLSNVTRKSIEQMDIGELRCLKVCHTFQEELKQQWRTTINSLSQQALYAMTLFPKDGKIISQPISDILKADYRKQSGRRDSPNDTWWIRGAPALREKFCRTMMNHEWGPEPTSSLGAFCGIFALSQSIAALENGESADINIELIAAKQTAALTSSRNFSGDELGVMVKLIRPGYALGIASRVRSPGNVCVYDVYSPAGADEASKAGQPVVWIVNNNNTPPDMMDDERVIMSHWQSFGPRKIQALRYIDLPPPGFI